MRIAQILTAVFVPAEEGGYVAYIEGMSGVLSQGKTLRSASRNLWDALELMNQVQNSQTNHANPPEEI